MSINVIGKLQQAARDTSPAAAAVKLVITILFVPLPILAGSLTGFWLDYYRLNTLPLLLVVGTLLGTSISFMGVYGIIVYRGGTR